MSLLRIESIYGPLPAEYKRFLATHDPSVQYRFQAHKPDALANRAWSLMTERQLFEPLHMKGVGSAERWSVMKLCLTAAFGKPRHELLVESPNGPLHLDRVFVGIAIGSENTDYLYLDPTDNFSVWMFHGDGVCDVERVSESFTEFVSRSVREE